MGQPQLPGRGPEILANLLRHPGGCCGVVTWSCAARTRHVSDLFLAGGVGWLLAAAMQDLDCRMLTERTVSIKCVFLSSTIPCTSQSSRPAAGGAARPEEQAAHAPCRVPRGYAVHFREPDCAHDRRCTRRYGTSARGGCDQWGRSVAIVFRTGTQLFTFLS